MQLLQLVNTVSNEAASCSHLGNAKRRDAGQASTVHFAVFVNEPHYSNLSALHETIKSLSAIYSINQSNFGPSELLKISSVGMITFVILCKCLKLYFSDACNCSATNLSFPEDDGLHIIDDTACIGFPNSPCARDGITGVRY